jgi:hypothetical protein
MPASLTRNLITGGAGFVGSHLVDRLMQAGEEVICLDNYFTGRKANIAQWIGHPRFELIRHDVTEPIKLEVDRIWHLACPASPVHYQFNPIKTAKTSFLGTYNMLGLVHDELSGPQDDLQRLGNLRSAQVVARRQHPHQLDHRNQGDEARRRRRQALDQLRGLGRLPDVVLHDVADQHVGIQSDHRADAPREAMVRFISSMETTFDGLPNIPFSSVTERFAATNRY